MKHVLFLLFSVLSWTYFTQENKLIPSKIDLEAKTIVVETLYLFGENHYSFNAALKIDSLSYESTNQFLIQKVGSSHFSISCLRNAYNAFFPITNLSVTAYGKNNKTWKFSIPCKVYPPVQVKFFSGNSFSDVKIDIQQDTIKNISQFYCKALWDCPSYLKIQQRFRGRFTVHVKDGNTLLQSMYGWYDTGDMTREINLTSFSKLKKVTVEIQESNLITLHDDQLKTREKLILSPSSAKKIVFLIK